MARVLAAVIAAIAVFVAVAPASADPIDDYRRNGTIDPCKYSDGQLKRGRDNLPPDVQQYAPGLADQLNAGREGCGGSSPGGANPRQTQAVPTPGKPTNGGGPGGTDSAAAVGKPSVPAPPAPTAVARRRLADISTPAVSARVDEGAPGWLAPLLIALAVVAALVAALRLTGVGAERFTRPLRASFGEAGGRSADAAAELWDRVRLGR